MERDFMGLNSKEGLVVVKEEIDVDDCSDSAFSKGSRMQRPFMYKLSAHPHCMTSKVAVEDWTKKVGPYPHSSSGGTFDHSHKSLVGELQKTFNHDRQVGPHSSQRDVQFVHRSHHVKMFSSPNKAVSMSHPFFKTHFDARSHDELAVGSMKEQSHGGTPVTGPNSILPSLGSVAGFTEEWTNFKSSGAPAQLTIFYKGAVNIYDNISPEKAQAIMMLAGNGSSVASTMGQSRTQAQAPTPKMAAGDGVLVSQPVNTPPCSALSSPISVSSRPVHQSCSGSNSSDELVAAQPIGLSANAVNSTRTVTTKTMMPSAVPQARKASLARFLEKRKERVMNMAPYNLGNKKSQECGTPRSNGTGLPATPGLVLSYEK